MRRDEVGERDFEIFRLLDLGDFVAFEGRLFRTKTGELSVLAARVHYLAKALRPLRAVNTILLSSAPTSSGLMIS